MSDYSEFKKKSLENPEIRAAYDELQLEYEITQAIIDTEKKQNLTQRDLSVAADVTRADISRIENGTRNTSLDMVKGLIESARHISGGEFAEQILADLLAEGYAGDALLSEFRSRQAKVHPAVEAMLDAAKDAADGKGEYSAYEDVFGTED